MEALVANKDSHNNVDQGWPKALAQQRQAGRVQEGMNELWRDAGHLGAIREAYKARGLQPPELPAELRPKASQAAPTRYGQNSLPPEQQQHHALATEQLAPGLRAFHLNRDGERIAMVQAGAPLSGFSAREAQSRSSEQHLAQAHQAAHAQTQDTARTPKRPRHRPTRRPSARWSKSPSVGRAAA